MDDTVVLVVDDDPETLALLQSIVAEVPGARPVAATDGERALKLARELKPALMLLDLRIPKITGAIVARRLKADPETSAIPIVAVSGLASGPRIAQEAGCDGWISKPFEIDEITYIVQVFLEQSRPRPPATDGAKEGR